jgi:hypothetical protein
MLGKYMPRADERWKLLFTLHDMADIIFAPKVTEGLSGFLGHLVADHHTYFMELLMETSDYCQSITFWCIIHHAF